MKNLFLFILLFTSIQINAQSYNISGKIIDRKSKQVITDISVGLVGTSYGCMTDDNGFFKLSNISLGSYNLCISGIGYSTYKSTIVVNKDLVNLLIEVDKKSIEIDQIVVTASRTERNLKDVPIPVQVISGKSIEKMQVSNMRDLLEFELPGINFNNNGGFDNINMLGFGSKYILFLVDGERMAGESFDNIDYNRINTQNIDRIEIIKGAASSLYGSNAIGGIINIITKKPREAFDTKVGVRYGSNNEQNYNILLSSKQKWGSFSLPANFKKRGVYTVQNTNIAGYTDYSITPKASFNLNPKTEIEVNAGYYFKERNPGGQDGTKIRDRFQDYTGGIKGVYTISDNQHISASVNYDKYDKYDYYKKLKEDSLIYRNEQWHMSSLYDMLIANKHSLVAGVEYFSDNLMTYMFKSDGYNTKKDAQTYSVFAQQDWILNNKVTLVGGLRYDYHSQFKGHLSPRLSAMYKPSQQITLRGGYTSGFRSPTLKELYTDWYHPYGGGFQIRGNKDLKAEVSNNFNISGEAVIGKFVATAMAQYSFFDNKIENRWIDKDTIQYFNMGKTKIFSTELSLSYKFTENLLAKGSYTYSHDDLGKQSIIRPHTATFQIYYTSSFFDKYNPSLSFGGKYFSGVNIYKTQSTDKIDEEAGSIADDTDIKTRYDGYSIWKLTLAQPMPFNFILNAGINNIFNYRAKSYSFYSSISSGRTFYIGLKWSLK